MPCRGPSASRTLILVTTAVVILIAPGALVEARTPALAIVMSSGSLWSCGKDNQGQDLSLCVQTDVVIYQLLAELDTEQDLYLVYFTIGRGNSTLGTYLTEVFANVEIPRPAGISGVSGPWPVGGCSDGSWGGVAHWGQTFNFGGIDGCTEFSFASTTDTFLANWHVCGGIPNCPYSATIRDYTGFLFSISVPEGQFALFTLHTRTTIAKPSGCCLRDLLASSEVVWSPQSLVRSSASPPPPPQFLGQSYLIVGVAAISTGVPFLIWRRSRARGPLPGQTQYQLLPRPAGVGLLSVVDLALGFFLLLVAWDLLPIPFSFFTISLSGFPLLGFFLAGAVLITALGLWLGLEWARALTVLGHALSIVKSLLDLVSLNPLQWFVRFLSVVLAYYIITYLVSPGVKLYFSRQATLVQAAT